MAAILLAGAGAAAAATPERLTVREYRVPAGSHPHDVAPAADGTVWYTGQHTAELGRLDPRTGRIRRVPLGRGSRPHGVIVGPGGAAWVTDSGLNAIVRVDGRTHRVRRFPLPAGSAYANLNTATFDRRGILCLRATSTTRRSPAATSRGSTRARAGPPCSSRRRGAKERGACGRTPPAGSG